MKTYVSAFAVTVIVIAQIGTAEALRGDEASSHGSWSAPTRWIDGGLLTVSMKVGDRNADVIVDTGASQSVLFGEGFASSVDSTRRLRRAYVASDETPAELIQPVGVAIGARRLEGRQLLAVVGRRYRLWPGVESDGLCGMDVLKGARWCIATDAGTIGTGLEVSAPTSAGGTLLTDGRGVVTAPDPFGVTRKFLIDSAAMGGLYLHKNTQAVYAAVREREHIHSYVEMRGPGGGTRRYLLFYPRVWSFGSIEFSNVPVFVLDPEDERTTPPQPDIIGMSVLRRFTVEFDETERSLRLTANSADPYLERILALPASVAKALSLIRCYRGHLAAPVLAALSPDELATSLREILRDAAEAGQTMYLGLDRSSTATLAPAGSKAR